MHFTTKTFEHFKHVEYKKAHKNQPYLVLYFRSFDFTKAVQTQKQSYRVKEFVFKIQWLFTF